jgi:hypothetical protein
VPRCAVVRNGDRIYLTYCEGRTSRGRKLVRMIRFKFAPARTVEKIPNPEIRDHTSLSAAKPALHSKATACIPIINALGGIGNNGILAGDFGSVRNPGASCQRNRR